LRRHGITVATFGVALLPCIIAGERGVPSSLLLLSAAIIVMSWRTRAISGPVAVFIGVLSTAAFLIVPLRTLGAIRPILAAQAGVLTLLIVSVKRLRSRLSREVGLVYAISSHLQEGVFVLNRNGHVASVNRAAAQLLGWQELDTIDRHVNEVLGLRRAGVEQPGQSSDLEQALQSAVPVQFGDRSFFRRDGSVLPVSCTLTPIIERDTVKGAVLTFQAMSSRQQTEVRESDGSLHHSLVQSSPDSVLVVDPYGFVVMVSGWAAQFHGYGSPDKMVGLRLEELFTEDSRLRVVEDKRKTLDEGGVRNAEYETVRRDGTSFPVEVNTAVIRDESGRPEALVLIERDITRHRQAEQMLLATQEQMTAQHAVAAVLSQSDTLGEVIPRLLETICRIGQWDVGAFWGMDASKSALTCIDTWQHNSVDFADFVLLSRQLSCPSAVDLPGRVWEDRRPVWVESVVADPDFSRALMASKDGLHTGFCFPIIGRGSFHGAVELFSREVRRVDQDVIDTMKAVAASVAQFMTRKEAERALEHQALHDALTDLPNRVFLQLRLERAIAAARTEDAHFAVLLLDLDRFKEVNDTFGHQYGDALLQQAARRLQGALRESDTVARLGGDEFAVLLPRTDQTRATELADMLLRCLEDQFVVRAQQVDVGTSIGIAVYPEHGEDATMLIKHADTAMYVAKRARSGFAVYEAEHDEHTPSRFVLTAALRHAIEHDELLLHYQIKVDARTGGVDTVEALARWYHPERGLLEPPDFIPLAEQTGLIKPLARWVLGEALRQCCRWHATGLDLCVAVNISAQNLQDPGLIDTIVSLLDETGRQPSDLALEITESALMADSSRALETLTALHEMGVKIAIDDFGTGYSSLSYLSCLNADEIKIDQSFVIQMLANERDRFITQAVIDLGHNLGLKVVAEGVEDQETWNRLVAMGCDQAQGRFLSGPLSGLEVISLLSGSLPATGHLGVVRPIRYAQRARRAGTNTG
jgi:diguanylate cyclase (GGDEF)-like protein/PAS domain S-box-containing protein